MVNKAESLGATPVISFGGAGQPELARSCSSTRRLTADYTSVVKRFHARYADFDIEGDALIPSATSPAAALRASISRRFAAIRSLEHHDRHLVVSLTIPSGVHGVTPASDDPDALALLKTAKRDRVRVDVVNLMTMDYFNGTATEMGSASLTAAEGSLRALRTIWPRDSYRNLGITPMIGMNDDTSETFTLADARRVAAWARRHHIGRLAFWSLSRDDECTGATTPARGDCSSISQHSLAFTAAFLGRH